MYRKANIIILIVAPLVGALIALLGALDLYTCPEIAVCGRPCVLCGCTRDFFRVLGGDWGGEMLNPNSRILFVLAVCNLIWRIGAALRKMPRSVIIADIAVHSVILTYFGWLNLTNLMG